MEISVSIIVPPVVCHNLDPHTGIPFMPHMAAHMAAALREANYNVQVIDCFGLQPNQRQIIGEFMLMGVDEDWVVDHLEPNTRICYIYCRTIAEFIAVERLIAKIKSKKPQIKIALFENIQAVTSYALGPVADEFLTKGCDLVILGEPETRAHAITEALINHTPFVDILGVAYPENGKAITTAPAELDKAIGDYPFPAWDLFPLEGYWQAGFAHAPAKHERFLPILTSRGCPYRCTFCISPALNPTWRGRPAQHVVDEMEHFYRTMKVTDFHVSDLDPTVSEKRTREICQILIKKNLPITWKLAQGTKIETIKSEETLELMKQAGCIFISFSPESGSKRLLEIMNKPFDHEHGLRMAKKMHQLGIRSQSVFIAGVPGEEEADRQLSVEYARKLIKAGVDEISCVIFTPLPGAVLSKELNDFTHYSQCTPSPAWRKDYKVVLAYRRRMYLNYFFYKMLFHPDKVLRELLRLVSGQFETKMEMSLFKQLKLYGLRYVPRLFKKLDAPQLKAIS